MCVRGYVCACVDDVHACVCVRVCVCVCGYVCVHDVHACMFVCAISARAIGYTFGVNRNLWL